MKKKYLFFIGLLSIGSLVATSIQAGEDIDLVKSAALNGLVKIDSVRGDVRIVGWDKAQISIVGELDDLAKELVFNIDGDRTHIKVEMPRGRFNWGDGSNLDIRVPKESRVDFSGVSTDIVADNITGGLRITSVSGDVRAKDLQGHLTLSTVSGGIIIVNSEGRLRSSSVSGDVDVLSHSGQAELKTVSGDVEIQIEDNERLGVKSISGEIDVISDLLREAIIEISSVSGDVDLELKGEIDANFDINAGMSGSIDNDLTDVEVSKTRIGRETLKMMLGDGSGQVRIKTVSADINIE